MIVFPSVRNAVVVSIRIIIVCAEEPFFPGGEAVAVGIDISSVGGAEKG